VVELHLLKSVALRLLFRLLTGYRREIESARWSDSGVDFSSQAMVYRGARSVLKVGRHSRIGPYVIIDLSNDPYCAQALTSVLTIGERTSIDCFCNVRARGRNHPDR
jgi:hypothetical protein